MISHGLRLDDVGTPALSWRDLKIILTRQEPHKSALWREKNPEDAPWDLQAQLLAEVVDMQHLLVWAKTKDGQKNRNRPKPVERPGNRPERYGKKPLAIDEMDEWLGWS